MLCSLIVCLPLIRLIAVCGMMILAKATGPKAYNTAQNAITSCRRRCADPIFLSVVNPGTGATVDCEGEQVAAWVRHLIKMAKEPVKGNRTDDLLVFVVDDDLSVRHAIKSLLQSVGLQVEDFDSAAELLKDRRLADRGAAACLVLDVRLPGVSGLDVQAELSNAAIGVPIIFITGHGDIPMTVRAIRAGAVEFLTKPFRDQDLIDAVQTALGRDRERRDLEMNVLDMRARFATLSPREKEVFSLVTAGLMNNRLQRSSG